MKRKIKDREESEGKEEKNTMQKNWLGKRDEMSSP